MYSAVQPSNYFVHSCKKQANPVKSPISRTHLLLPVSQFWIWSTPLNLASLTMVWWQLERLMRYVTTATSHFAPRKSDPLVKSLLSIPLLSCCDELVDGESFWGRKVTTRCAHCWCFWLRALLAGYLIGSAELNSTVRFYASGLVAQSVV